MSRAFKWAFSMIFEFVSFFFFISISFVLYICEKMRTKRSLKTIIALIIIIAVEWCRQSLCVHAQCFHLCQLTMAWLLMLAAWLVDYSSFDLRFITYHFSFPHFLSLYLFQFFCLNNSLVSVMSQTNRTEVNVVPNIVTCSVHSDSIWCWLFFF